MLYGIRPALFAASYSGTAQLDKSLALTAEERANAAHHTGMIIFFTIFQTFQKFLLRLKNFYLHSLTHYFVNFKVKIVKNLLIMWFCAFPKAAMLHIATTAFAFSFYYGPCCKYTKNKNYSEDNYISHKIELLFT